MNRFNLTFRGDIIEGHDPAQAKARLAQVLEIDDPVRLQQCFSGDTVVLCRNLERKEAAEMYARLRRLGVLAELVRINERGNLNAGEKPGTASSVESTAQAEDSQTTSPDIPVAAAGAEPPAATVQQPDNAETQLSLPLKQSGSAPTPTTAKAPLSAIDNTSRPTSRRADLAVARALQEKEAAVLQAKEQELQKLLRAKKREKLKSARASKRAKQKSAAREASHRAKLEAEAEEKRQAELHPAPAREPNKRAQERAEGERLAAQKRERLAAKRAEKEKLEEARQAKKRHLAAEKAAQRAEEKRKAEEIADQLRVENARRKREQAEAAARKKAEEKAAEAEHLGQRRAMEEQAIRRAAVELAHKPSLGPVDARVKTRLETPSTLRRSADDTGRRKRQVGEPNLYSLNPFRNTPAIRARAHQSRQIKRMAFSASAAALGAVLILIAGQLGISTPTRPPGAGAIAVTSQGKPLLLAGDHLLLHDRAGVSISDHTLADLGLQALRGPMAFTPAGELLAPGRIGGAQEQDSIAAPAELIRCTLTESRCEMFSEELAGTTISALGVNPVDGVLFIADSSADQLLKVSPQGKLLARASLELPEQPSLRLEDGLLLVTGAVGPTIDIYRYENDAFGTQLDEVLLQPPDSDTKTFTGVIDFLRSGGYWWALLSQEGKEQASLYRFDPLWEFMDAPALSAGSRPTQLVAWGSRTLVVDPGRVGIQRFNSQGAIEAPMVSAALQALLTGQERLDSLIRLAWRGALAFCLLAAAAGLCLGWLHRARSLVYTSCQEEGASPLDEVTRNMEWVEPAPDRAASLLRRGHAYAALVALAVVAAIVAGTSSLQLSALLLALAGPAIALLVLQRSDPGHIGVNGRQLLLVDHTGMYHFGGGSRIHYRGPFVMIDDVTVFTGTRLLPAFERNGIEQNVAPAAAGGVRVDRTIVTVKLLQGRHPLALGAVVIAATSATAIALLSLQGIF